MTAGNSKRSLGLSSSIGYAYQCAAVLSSKKYSSRAESGTIQLLIPTNSGSSPRNDVLMKVMLLCLSALAPMSVLAFHRPTIPPALSIESRKSVSKLYCSTRGHDETDVGKFFTNLYTKVQTKLNEGKQFELIAWAFKYGDTRPFSERSVVGWLFLATNVFYFLSSANLYQVDNTVATTYGIIIDVAGLFSFIYHYTQLKYGPNRIGK